MEIKRIVEQVQTGAAVTHAHLQNVHLAM